MGFLYVQAKIFTIKVHVQRKEMVDEEEMDKCNGERLWVLHAARLDSITQSVVVRCLDSGYQLKIAQPVYVLHLR